MVGIFVVGILSGNDIYRTIDAVSKAKPDAAQPMSASPSPEITPKATPEPSGWINVDQSKEEHEEAYYIKQTNVNADSLVQLEANKYSIQWERLKGTINKLSNEFVPFEHSRNVAIVDCDKRTFMEEDGIPAKLTADQTGFPIIEFVCRR
jgi:hypothetical protein